jgi:hypothetical protein
LCRVGWFDFVSVFSSEMFSHLFVALASIWLRDIRDYCYFTIRSNYVGVALTPLEQSRFQFSCSRSICDENPLKISGQQPRRKILTSHVFGSPAPVNGGAANQTTGAQSQGRLSDNLDRRRRAIPW